jgi:3'-phosphoadenosine 5'-phosphosulfate sulfotransferase
MSLTMTHHHSHSRWSILKILSLYVFCMSVELGLSTVWKNIERRRLRSQWPRSIFRRKRQEETAGRVNTRSECLLNLQAHSAPHIIRVVNEVRMGTALLQMRKMRNEDKLSAGKPEWKRTFGRPSR